MSSVSFPSNHCKHLISNMPISYPIEIMIGGKGKVALVHAWPTQLELNPITVT